MIETPKVVDPSLVYMYGLADFWVDMFGDKQLVETLLAGETIQLGEAYSYFLQRAAGISLTDIQDKYESRIQLLLLSESDLVDSGDKCSFKIDSSIVDISKIANRPILPTQTLSYGIHFDIEDDVLKFYRPIDELKFPVRHNPDGTWQYAIWMCDVEINEKWIENNFGRLVGFTEEDAIFNYKSFLEGVYFLYANGPNISFIERGVNLAMGMPYARSTENILDILRDEVSGNWFIFTATQQYEIPYAYRPDLYVGDTLTEGEVLSTWVEVRDHTTSGAWWYQIYLPREVLGGGEDPSALGKAVQGSTADNMMESFLKHHMFEVLITQPTSDITAFNTAKGLVLRSKPEYTYPVFVWRAAVDDEIIELEDDFVYTYLAERTDHCVSPPSIRYMDRGEDDDLFMRGTNWYNRIQGSMYAASILGYGDWPGNGGWSPQFDSIDERYLSYTSATLRTRSDTITPVNRGTVLRGWRGVPNEYREGLIWDIPASRVYGTTGDYQINERSLTPLYLMSRAELVDKMMTVDPRFKIGDRNNFVISGLDLVDVYDTWMLRNEQSEPNEDTDYKFGYSNGDLDIAFSPFAYQTYTPSRDDMYDNEGMPIIDGVIFITRSTDSSWSCQWVRTVIATSPTLFPIEDQDHTRAIEEYAFEDFGNEYGNYGISINAEVSMTQTPRLITDIHDSIVIVDGKYVSTLDYDLIVENTRAETPTFQPDDPNTVELDLAGRSFISLHNSPVVSGYTVYDEASSVVSPEEFIAPEIDGTYILSTQPTSKEDILVVVDGEFIFDYTLAGDILTVNVPSTEVFIRYVSHSSEEVLPAGSSSYTLSIDGHCKIFIGSRLLEDWAFVRNGTNIELPYESAYDLTIRYDTHEVFTKQSSFTRSTIERNQARFLMDRSREDGEYDDYLGNTVFMNRSGVPTLSDGSDADLVNVIRRLR